MHELEAKTEIFLNSEANRIAVINNQAHVEVKRQDQTPHPVSLLDLSQPVKQP